MRAAHHLCNNGDLGVVQYDVKVVYHKISKGAVGKISQIENVFYGVFTAKSFFYYFFVFGQDFSRAASNNAESENSNFYHLRIPGP